MLEELLTGLVFRAGKGNISSSIKLKQFYLAEDGKEIPRSCQITNIHRECRRLGLWSLLVTLEPSRSQLSSYLPLLTFGLISELLPDPFSQYTFPGGILPPLLNELSFQGQLILGHWCQAL